MYKIEDVCLNCGACVPNCPAEAIYEANGICVIDEERCIDCNICLEVCPIAAPIKIEK
ncbi:4Fe-4S dicluster domain-containing protein [Clostridium cavendishii DSM 21758]|uniref:4Fe-4S dicluster domain-containing protein n=1 Tax=Clostridium cavendishii DSM 21758 TaxID=1121302 RepID=A0A1M6IBA7_9CLOT|nr:4Fe-4S dicluster domain-containing protein [Clostridium cavendishii DSM 21758]